MATTPLRTLDSPFTDAFGVADRLQANLNGVIRGKPDVVRLAVVTVLAGGHLLLEDVPGVGKTLLAKSIARSLGGVFRRVQATSDLLPADLTGVAMFDQSDGSWKFRPGPLFANVVLVDEINRATPRTQSALLEAMEERQVSADGATRRLPEPFVVIGTQNPQEHHGTFPLVEGQRDRFTMILHLGLPDRAAERAILAGDAGVGQLQAVEPVGDVGTIQRAIQAIKNVHAADAVTDYLLDIVDATRDHEAIALGASPRASLSLLRASQANAVCDGRTFITPTDVKVVARGALAHRIVASSGGDVHHCASLIDGILRRVPPPRG